jgi:hypothetical protein
MMNILVLGSGMAGLLAAKAAEDVTGGVPDIMTDRMPQRLSWAEMMGIHVLHDSCSMNLDDMWVNNLVILPNVEQDGKAELLAEMSSWERKMANASYGQKLYGSRRSSTSLMRMPGVIQGYDYVQAYNLMLDRYQPGMKVAKPIDEDRLHGLTHDYDLVISTIPRHFITPPWVQHPFSSAYVSQRPPIGFAAEKYMGSNFVVYNTDPGASWSRTARIISGQKTEHWTTEYNSVPKTHIPDLRQVNKVMQCEEFALPKNVLTVGRFGRWEPGVLAHDAYWDVVAEVRRRA